MAPDENPKNTFHHAQVSGLRLRYWQRGTGPSLLLLHGWGCRIETMLPLAEELSRQFSVTILDLPGHGESSLPPAPWGTADYGRCIADFAGLAGLGPTDILGHSVGGRFAAWIAAQEPGKVRRLILANSSGIKPPRPLAFYLKIALAKTGKFAEKYLGSAGARLKQAIYSRVASADYQSSGPLRLSFIKIVNEEIRELLPAIRCPTLLVWGADDRDTPPASAQVFQQLIAQSDLVILPKTGHYTYLDDPFRFVLEVKKFLTS